MIIYIGQQGGGQKAKGPAGSSGRNESKGLSSAAISESNVLDFMASVEQRAVDIISEYLLTNQTDVGGNKYPTPGPTTPMRQGRFHIDLNESNIVDEAETNMPLSANSNEGFADPDSKPIDLHAYYDKLKKRKNTQNLILPSAFGNSALDKYNNSPPSAPGLLQSKSSTHK